jgi:hypothetical protein
MAHLRNEVNEVASATDTILLEVSGSPDAKILNKSMS